MPRSSLPPRRRATRESHAWRAPDSPAAFRLSMPARYRGAFEGVAVREHAAIVARRDDRPAHVEIWRRQPRGGAVLCVVADDRPGLLSFVSASLAAEKLEVASAQAYTRPRADGQGAEAVDFLWVRRDRDSARPVRGEDAARIATVLSGLVTGATTLESVRRRAPARAGTPRGGVTRVTFDDASEAGLAIMTVETYDRPGLLLAITLALFRAAVQIVASDATTEDGRVVDRFTIAELDGSPVVRHRRGAVQTAVLAALDSR